MRSRGLAARLGALRALRARPRLLTAVSLAAALFLTLFSLPLSTRLLVAWDAGAIVYLLLALTMMARSDVQQMRRRAEGQDEGEVFILLITSLAAIASLAAIGAELHGTGSGHSETKLARISLAALTIFCSWFFVHTAFALHYAHEFYAGEGGETGGLEFPRGNREPDYWDFLYFSFNLGAACQTSDVVICSRRMRRIALGHTVLSFLFNATILALAVNVGASVL